MKAATGFVGAGMLALAGVAHADVKAGVDAWSTGDFARAVAEWRAPAANGDADAMFNMAQAYRLGRGVPEDAKEAETLYAHAAAKGHLKAADNYGLLLFQDGRREQAMPYVTAAAERGDPRAQYLIGIAHFNGDLAAKDWVRAYALLTLANGAGLPQAGSALRQMDEHMPLAQRQQAQSLAATLRADADAARSSQLAALDLEGGTATQVIDAPSTARRASKMPQTVASVAVPPSIGTAAEAAGTEAMRATGSESPAAAGADYTRSTRSIAAIASPAATDVPSRVVRRELLDSAPGSTNGPWKLQLGAFSVAGNAEKAWKQVSGKSALAG
ncbi:MAG: tetratricopeptide repeat protein, partial [Tsuneonella sp.]